MLTTLAASVQAIWEPSGLMATLLSGWTSFEKTRRDASVRTSHDCSVPIGSRPLQENRCRPDGWKTRPDTCPATRIVLRLVVSGTSQSLITPSPPEARVLLSGERAGTLPRPGGWYGVAGGLPWGPKGRTLPSCPPVATILLSGETARAVTVPSCAAQSSR